MATDSLFKSCVAVVGSRHMTSYGKAALEKLIPELVFSGKTIVSGFMYGVDQYAHSLAIDNGGKTLAVLGWGINLPLMDEDRKLADRILASGGLLFSEWENQKAALWTFRVRNCLGSGVFSGPSNYFIKLFHCALLLVTLVELASL